MTAIFHLLATSLRIRLGGGKNGRNTFTSLLHKNSKLILLSACLVMFAVQYTTLMPASMPHQEQAATESQTKAGKSQIQLSHATSMDRYPDEYSAVQKYFQTQLAERSDTKKKKMLSFGSSTGEEAITLASMYFENDAITVFGVDLHQESIDKANVSVATHEPKFKDGKIIIFNGNDTDLNVNGPYDAIFANSVLCYHGSRGVSAQSIVKKYPFADFEASLGYLDANLKVGGILAIVNTNYHFSDTQLYTKYKPLSRCINFVPKVDSKSIVYEELKKDYDCVWVKENN